MEVEVGPTCHPQDPNLSSSSLSQILCPLAGAAVSVHLDRPELRRGVHELCNAAMVLFDKPRKLGRLEPSESTPSSRTPVAVVPVDSDLPRPLPLVRSHAAAFPTPHLAGLPELRRSPVFPSSAPVLARSDRWAGRADVIVMSA